MRLIDIHTASLCVSSHHKVGIAKTEISENVFYRIMYLRRDLELIRFTESCNFCEFVLKGQGRRLQNLEGHVERIPNKGNVQLEFPRKESG